MAAAYKKGLTRDEFLAAMLVAYEATIRSGVAIMDYYNYAHSSGTFGAIGVAVGVGRIYGFTKEEMNNVISVAEFNAPLVPGIRSVEYPSMNKDGKAYTSPDCEPRGEAHENISVEWLADKFRRITAPVLDKSAQDMLIEAISREEDMPIRDIVDMACGAIKRI